MSDLIRREDVITVLCFCEETKMMLCGDLRKILEKINEIPSAEPERTAKVEKITLKEDVTIGAGTFKKGTTVLSKCGACGGYVRPSDIYCVNCGARLEWK